MRPGKQTGRQKPSWGGNSFGVHGWVFDKRRKIIERKKNNEEKEEIKRERRVEKRLGKKAGKTKRMRGTVRVHGLETMFPESGR